MNLLDFGHLIHVFSDLSFHHFLTYRYIFIMKYKTNYDKASDEINNSLPQTWNCFYRHNAANFLIGKYDNELIMLKLQKCPK